MKFLLFAYSFYSHYTYAPWRKIQALVSEVYQTVTSTKQTFTAWPCPLWPKYYSIMKSITVYVSSKQYNIYHKNYTNTAFLIARHFVEGNVYIPFLLFMCLCQRGIAFMCAYVSVQVQVSWHWRASSTLALLSVLILCMTCVCMSACEPWHTYRSQEDMLCVNLLLPSCLRQTLQSPPSSCCRYAEMAYMCYCTQALCGFWKFRLWPSGLCGEYLPWCLIILSHYKLQASNIQKNWISSLTELMMWTKQLPSFV